jgi:CubicO group peptidase (beta-lactamase class C family)
MTLTSQNVVAWHDRSVDEHYNLVDEWAKKGFRTLSLTIYGSTQDPLYAAVVVKRLAIVATRQFGPLNQTDMQETFDDMVDQGWGPYILTATGTKNSAVFAGVFTPMKKIPFTRLNLSGEDFKIENDDQQANGKILIWADAFGTPDDTRYTAIWGDNPNRHAWNCDAIDEDGVTLQERFFAMSGTWCRPSHISVTPSGRHLNLFVDSSIGPWSQSHGMTSDEYQVEYDKAVKNGLQPIRVSAAGSGTNTRFAAIFASREEIDSRVFRSKGPVTVAAIDSAMESYMKDHNLRGVALAIVLGTRLVYAKGYTYAELDYPDVLPTTPFRQASVSKMFTAVALWRLMQQNSNITLETTMQSVLNLTQPNGAAPKDSRFGQIKLKHLLESRSGLDQGIPWMLEEAANAAGHFVPVNHDELMRYAASLNLKGQPGLTLKYGNFDYFMLSQVIRKLANAPHFEKALEMLVLAPLKMTHTRTSHSLVGAHASDDPRHHLTVYDPLKIANQTKLFPLLIGNSVMSTEWDGTSVHRPKVAYQYGSSYDYELGDGSGGLSSAVIDVARLVAMFSDRISNPVLSSDTLDKLFTNAAAATANFKPPYWGFHGFDEAYIDDSVNHVYRANKNGFLPSHESNAVFSTGGLGFIIAQNGNRRPEHNDHHWLNDGLSAAALAYTWPDLDLFVEFGMPSLAPILIAEAALSEDMLTKLSPQKAEKAVRAAMGRSLERPRRP